MAAGVALVRITALQSLSGFGFCGLCGEKRNYGSVGIIVFETQECSTHCDQVFFLCTNEKSKNVYTVI